jgi:hypothetical protein
MMFRAVFWVVLPCKDSSEHHTRRRENLKSHKCEMVLKLLGDAAEFLYLVTLECHEGPWER